MPPSDLPAACVGTVGLHNLHITDPVALESAINQVVGVVTVGLFARRPADVVLVGGGAA